MTLIWINFLYLILVLTMLPYYLPLLLSGERGSMLLEMVLLFFFNMLILKMRYRSHNIKVALLKCMAPWVLSIFTTFCNHHP